MSLSIDSFSYIATTGVSVATWNHTCSGTNRMLCVSVSYNDWHIDEVAPVTYGGIPLTYVPGSEIIFGDLSIATRLYYLVAPPTGTFPIVVTLTGSFPMINFATSYNGASGTIGTTNNDAEYGSSYNPTMGSEQYGGCVVGVDRIFFSVTYNGNGAPTMGTGNIALLSEDNGASFGATLVDINPTGTIGGAWAPAIPGTGFINTGVVVQGGIQVLPAFHEIRMDPRIVYDSTVSHEYSTAIVPVPSGDEYRKQFWATGRRKWTISKQMLDNDAMASLVTFFRGRRGRAYGFRIRDWSFYKVTDIPLPIMTGTGGLNAQLQYTYDDPINPETICITKPVLVSDVNNDITQPAWNYSPDITLKNGGVAWDSAGNWTLDRTTGLLTYAADQTDSTITWSGSFDFPARFDSDAAAFKREDLNIQNWNDIQIVQLKF